MTRSVAVAAFLFTLVTTPLFAQATRTWVSGVGDDVNPCSRTAPCKTFAGAISKTATGGEIDTLDPGGFGAVTIIKSMTIDGGPFAGGTLAGAGTNGIVINATPTSTIILRNLSIVGTNGLNGIRIVNAGVVQLENVRITGFTRGIDYNVTNSSPVPTLQIVNSTITNNDPTNLSGGGGLLIRPLNGQTVNVFLDNVKFDRNNFGIRVEDGGKVVATNTKVSNSQNAGYVVVAGAGAPSQLNLESCAASGNSVGVKADSNNAINTATIRLSRCVISGNATGLQATGVGGAIVSQVTNWFQGNTTNGGPTATQIAQ